MEDPTLAQEVASALSPAVVRRLVADGISRATDAYNTQQAIANMVEPLVLAECDRQLQSAATRDRVTKMVETRLAALIEPAVLSALGGIAASIAAQK